MSDSDAHSDSVIDQSSKTGTRALIIQFICNNNFATFLVCHKLIDPIFLLLENAETECSEKMSKDSGTDVWEKPVSTAVDKTR